MTGPDVTYYVYAASTGMLMGNMVRSIMDAQPENATIDPPIGAGEGQCYYRIGREWVALDPTSAEAPSMVPANAETDQLELEF